MRQKKKLKKALSLLLTAAMVLSLNVPVFADEADDGNGEDNATNSVQVLDATDGEDVQAIDNVPENEGVKVAKIGDTAYATLQEAMAEAVSGNTVSLVGEAIENETVVVKDGITLEIAAGASLNGQVEVQEGGKLIVNGAITYDSQGSAIISRGTVQIGEGAAVTAKDSDNNGAVYIIKGSFEMSGGTITSEKKSTNYGRGLGFNNNADASGSITGGTINAVDIALLIRSGGLNSDFSIQNVMLNCSSGTNVINGTYLSNIAEGSSVYQDGKTWTIGSGATSSVKTEDNVYYPTVAAALKAGTTVEVLGAMTENVTVPEGKTLTVNEGAAIAGRVTNNGTLVVNGAISGNVVNNGSMEVKGIVSAVSGNAITSSGKLIMNEGSTVSATNISNGAVRLTGGTFTMNGGTIDGATESISSSRGLYIPADAGVDAVIYDGEIYGTNYAVVNYEGNTLRLEGGTFKSDDYGNTKMFYRFEDVKIIEGKSYQSSSTEEFYTLAIVSAVAKASNAGEVSSYYATLNDALKSGMPSVELLTNIEEDVVIPEGVTLTVKDGIKINGKVTVHGTLNMTGGTIEKVNAGANGVVYVTGTGTLNMSGGEILGMTQGPLTNDYFRGVTLDADATANISGGSICGYQYAIVFREGANVKVSGGTFTNDTIRNESVIYNWKDTYLAAGVALEKVTAHKWQVGDFSASVTNATGDETYYASLEEAVAAASDDATVTLKKNVEVSSIVIAKPMTLDFAGYTVTKNVKDEEGTVSYALGITADVTLKDGTITCDATTYGAGETRYAVVPILIDGTETDVVLNGITVEKSYNGIQVNAGNTVTLDNNSAVTGENFGIRSLGQVTMNSGTVTGGEIGILVTGTSGNLTMVGGEVISNTEESVGVQVQLGANMSMTGGKVNADAAKSTGIIVIDANSGEKTSAQIKGDSEVYGSGTGICIAGNCSYGNDAPYPAEVTVSGNARVYGKILEGEVGGTGIYIVGNGAVLNVQENCTVEGSWFAISGNGSYGGQTDNGQTVINISGGTVDGHGSTAIYQPQYGKLNVTGGTIKGITGIEIRAGELDVSGGEITGTAERTETKPNGNGTTTIGAAVAVAQHNTKRDITVTISGGTLTGCTALCEKNTQKNGTADVEKIKMTVDGGTFITTNKDEDAEAIVSEDCSNFVNGGKFSAPVSYKYCQEGLASAEVDGESGMWTVTALKEGQYDISAYRSEETYTYPTNENGDLFAGWFEDAELTEQLTDSSVTTGRYYAKFVDKRVLEVRYQRASYNKDGSMVYNIRMYSALDSLDYSLAGFIINNGSNEWNEPIKKVYTSYNGIKPTQIGGDQAKYLFVYTLENVSPGTTLTITPYWTTMDGTTVMGTTATIQVP